MEAQGLGDQIQSMDSVSAAATEMVDTSQVHGTDETAERKGEKRSRDLAGLDEQVKSPSYAAEHDVPQEFLQDSSTKKQKLEDSIRAMKDAWADTLAVAAGLQAAADCKEAAIAKREQLPRKSGEHSKGRRSFSQRIKWRLTKETRFLTNASRISRRRNKSLH